MVTPRLLGELHVVTKYMFLVLVRLDGPFSEPLNSFGVPHPEERLLGFDKSGVEFLNGFRGYWILQCEINNPTDESFDMRQEGFERSPVELRFGVRVL